MTKEELQALGLDEDQIKEVFKLNGIAVGNAKKGVDLLDKEIENLTEQLKTANSEIEGFKGIDVEELKGKIEDYKTKYEDTEKEYSAKLEEIKFTHDLESSLRGYNPHDIKDIIPFIDREKLKRTDDGITGLKEQVEELQKSKSYLFPETEPEDKGKAKFKGFVPVDGGTGDNSSKSVGSKFAEKRNSESKVTSNLWG